MRSRRAVAFMYSPISRPARNSRALHNDGQRPSGAYSASISGIPARKYGQTSDFMASEVMRGVSRRLVRFPSQIKVTNFD